MLLPGLVEVKSGLVREMKKKMICKIEFSSLHGLGWSKFIFNF